MGDATRKTERTSPLVQRAGNNSDYLFDQVHSLVACGLCVAAFLKCFPIVRSRRVTRSTVTQVYMNC